MPRMPALRSSVPLGAVAAIGVLAIGLAVSAAPSAPEGPRRPPGSDPHRRVTVDALSVVKLRARAVDSARSSRTLGAEREGTGVVLDGQGLVLTIGYLVLEAESVELSTADGRSFPAAVIGIDSVTGLGLVRSLQPLPITPVELTDSSKIAAREPVLIVGFDGVALAQVVSRRPFAGSWEYLLDEAIYTAPATVNWSGAALLNREGKLLGIGSLAVNDATGPDSHVSGNLFVPINLFKPLMNDLLARGRSSAPPRPWLGVHTHEMAGNVIVTRVSPDSPADAAALRPGDVIITLGGRLVRGQADFYKRLWAHGPPGVDVALEVLRDGRIQPVTVKSTDRDQYYRAKPVF